MLSTRCSLTRGKRTSASRSSGTEKVMLTAVAMPSFTAPTGTARVEVSSSRVPSIWRMISVARSRSRMPAWVRSMPRA